MYDYDYSALVFFLIFTYLISSIVCRRYDMAECCICIIVAFLVILASFTNVLARVRTIVPS